MTRRLFFVSFAVLLLTSSLASARVFKIATVSPDGTFWMQQMRAGAETVEKETQGRVKFKFYPGGVMGSDENVLRKIRIGQLHGGAITSGSLVDIAPDVSIYELPYLFDSLEQVDYVRARMDAELIDSLEDSGFVGFGLAEGGFSYMMSDEALQSIDDVRSKKVWLPNNHAVGEAVFKAAEIPAVTLPIADVLTALQTGLIDTVITSPIAAIALQWHTRIGYLVDEPLTYFSALLIIEKKSFEKLEEQDRAVVRRVMGEVFRRIDQQNRQDNVDAREALKKQGIEFVRLTPASLGEWRALGDVAMKHLEKQNSYSEKAYGDLMKYLEESRKIQE